MVLQSMLLAMTVGACGQEEAIDANSPAVATHKEAVFSAPPAIGRFYKTPTGEHFYTANPGEAFANGFHLEAFPYFWLSPFDAPELGIVPLYRCFWRSTGKHFYTTSPACEYAPNMTFEGEIGGVATTQQCGTTALYRMYNRVSHDHFYTTSAEELTSLIQAQERTGRGYVYEGIQGYVYTSPAGPDACDPPPPPPCDPTTEICLGGGRVPGDGGVDRE
jgi:hypothetical protein